MQVGTSSQTTTPTSHHSILYRPDALPATQPTASKHWYCYQSMESIPMDSKKITKMIFFCLPGDVIAQMMSYALNTIFAEYDL